VDLDQVGDGASLRGYAMAAYSVGDFVLATDLLDRALTAFRQAGQLGMLPIVLALQLQIRLHLGDWSGAAAASEEVVTVSRETGQALFADNNVLVEARGVALRGDWRAALMAMSAAEADALESRINDRICLAYQARGAAMLSADRPADAFACLSRQFDPADPGYHLRESFAAVALLAEAAVECGRVAEARAIVGVLNTVAVITPSPVLEVNLLYANSVLAPESEREGRYRQALAYDLGRWPWLRARVDLTYGQWSGRSGRSAEAEASLRRALATFDELGAVRWARAARTSLQVLDERGSDQP
jgi:hypothetical protein